MIMWYQVNSSYIFVVRPHQIDYMFLRSGGSYFSKMKIIGGVAGQSVALLAELC